MSVADFNQAARDAGMVSGKQIDGHVIGPDTKWYHGTDLPTDASLSVPDGAYGLHFSRQREIAGDYADVRGHLRGYEGGIARPFTMPPTGSPNYSEALARAQEMLPGFDGTKASLFANSESYNKILREKGYDGILSKDGVLLDDPYEAIAFYPERMDRLFANDANASYSSLLLNSEDGQHRSFIDDLPRISTRDE